MVKGKIDKYVVRLWMGGDEELTVLLFDDEDDYCRWFKKYSHCVNSILKEGWEVLTAGC